MADTDNSRDRGGIHVTNTGGNVTIGDNNTVTSTVNGTQPARDPRQEQLLQAVLRLRADLRGVVATDRTAALDEELSDTADEIEGRGSADAGRLRRLRQALTDAGAVTGILASGVAVGQAVGTLLGG
ncbi:hypothetical protein ACWGK1_37795 [Streptomyces wedmorensis]